MKLVDFEIAKEEWTIVELEDGTVLRMRPVLLFLRLGKVKKRKVPRPAMRIGFQFGVWAKSKGGPTKDAITPKAIGENIVKENLSFRFLQRGESHYRFNGRTIQIKAIPTQFDKTRLFDKDGEPVYRVLHELTVLGER